MPLWCCSCERAVCGDGAIASTSPPRMAWISEFVSWMNRNTISCSNGFLPYHPGFAISVASVPLRYDVSRNGPSEIGLAFAPHTQFVQILLKSCPRNAWDG